MLDKEKNKGVLRPYLANLNVRWGTFDLSDLREMRFEDREIERYGVRGGDVVMCEGGEPGRCAIWRDQRPGMMLQKALHRIRSKSEIDHRFLFYSLLHKGQTHALDQYFTGATIKHLPGEKLALVEVEYPTLGEQRRIASILSAYDDLIENNTRRIAILEEMARRIYEEWFVRFRFPGHEGVRMVEAELGLVPEGWVVAPLGGIAKLLSGFAFKSSTFVENGDYGLVTIKNVHDGVFIENCTSRLSNPPGNMPTHCSLKVADILLSLTGNVGRCCLVTVDGCLLNQRVAKIQPVKAFDWVDLTRFHGRYELLH
jgi:type I restriction enzyme S subunit